MDMLRICRYDTFLVSGALLYFPCPHPLPCFGHLVFHYYFCLAAVVRDQDRGDDILL